jgi:hypothetical protein
MSDRAVAPIGLAQSLRRYPLTKETEISIAPKLDIEAATRPPRPTTNVVGPIPSRASTPLSECHRYATTVVRPCERFCASEALLLSDQRLPTVPSEVLSPTASCQPCGATDLQRVPTRWSRCALRVSHPLDALLPTRSPGPISSRSRSWGLPFEALLPARCRTPSQTPSPSGFLKQPRLKTAPRPFRGLTHRPEPKPPVLGISQDTTLVPPWAFSLRGFLS